MNSMDACDPNSSLQPPSTGGPQDTDVPLQDRAYPVFLSGKSSVWGRPNSHKSVGSRLVSGLDAVKRQLSVIQLSMQHLQAFSGHPLSKSEREQAIAIANEFLENLEELSGTATAQIDQLFKIVRKNLEGSPVIDINRPVLDAPGDSGIWPQIQSMTNNLYELIAEYQLKASQSGRQKSLIAELKKSNAQLASQAEKLEQALNQVRAATKRPLDRQTVARALAAWTKGAWSEPGFLQKSWLFVQRLPLRVMDLLALPSVLKAKVSSYVVALFDGAFCCLFAPSVSISMEPELRAKELKRSRLKQVSLDTVSKQIARKKVAQFVAQAQQTISPRARGNEPSGDDISREHRRKSRLVSDRARASFERRVGNSPEHSRIAQPHQLSQQESYSAARDQVVEQHREAVIRSQSSDHCHVSQEVEKHHLEEVNWQLVCAEEKQVETEALTRQIAQIREVVAALADGLIQNPNLRAIENGLNRQEEELANVYAGLCSTSSAEEEQDLWFQYQQLNGDIKQAKAVLRQLWLQECSQEEHSCLTEIDATLRELQRELQSEGLSHVRIDAITKVLNHLKLPSITPDFWPTLNALLHSEESMLCNEVYRNIGTVEVYAANACSGQSEQCRELRAMCAYLTPGSLVEAATELMDSLPVDGLTREQILQTSPELNALLKYDAMAIPKVMNDLHYYLDQHLKEISRYQAVIWNKPEWGRVIQLLLGKLDKNRQVMQVVNSCPEGAKQRLFSSCVDEWQKANPNWVRTDFYQALTQTTNDQITDFSFESLMNKIGRHLPRPLCVADRCRFEQIYCLLVYTINNETSAAVSEHEDSHLSTQETSVNDEVVNEKPVTRESLTRESLRDESRKEQPLKEDLVSRSVEKGALLQEGALSQQQSESSLISLPESQVSDSSQRQQSSVSGRSTSWSDITEDVAHETSTHSDASGDSFTVIPSPSESIGKPHTASGSWQKVSIEELQQGTSNSMSWQLLNSEPLQTENLSLTQQMEQVEKLVDQLGSSIHTDQVLRDMEVQLKEWSEKLMMIKGEICKEAEQPDFNDDPLWALHEQVTNNIKAKKAAIRQLWLEIRTQSEQRCLHEIRNTLDKLKAELIAEQLHETRINAIDAVLQHLKTETTDRDFWPILNALLNVEGSMLRNEVYRNIGTVVANAERVCAGRLKKVQQQSKLVDYVTPTAWRQATINFIDKLPIGTLTREQVLRECPEIIGLDNQTYESWPKLMNAVSSYLNQQQMALAKYQSPLTSNRLRTFIVEQLLEEVATTIYFADRLKTCPADERRRVLSLCITAWLDENKKDVDADLFDALNRACEGAELIDLSWKTLMNDIQQHLKRQANQEDWRCVSQIFFRVLKQVRQEFGQK